VKTIGLMMLWVGLSVSAVAGGPVATPEIDSTTALGALTLLSGALLVVRGRRRTR
jgi:hypothetical protein